VVKADVEELKGQMGQILEALKVLPIGANLGQVCVQKDENSATIGENKLGAIIFPGSEKTI